MGEVGRQLSSPDRAPDQLSMLLCWMFNYFETTKKGDSIAIINEHIQTY